MSLRSAEDTKRILQLAMALNSLTKANYYLLKDEGIVIKEEMQKRNMKDRAEAIALVFLLAFVFTNTLFFCMRNIKFLGHAPSVIWIFPTVGIGALLLTYAFYCWNKKRQFVKDICAPLVTFFVLVLGVLFMGVFTPTSVPDESYHYSNAYYYANALCGTPDSENTLSIRQNDRDLLVTGPDIFTEIIGQKNYSLAKEKIAADEHACEEMVQIQRDSSALSFRGGTPQTRLPAALGIALGRICSLNAFGTFMLGRFLNLLYFAFFVYLAIRFTPVGKAIFSCVALLPMTLHLAASFSYDAGVMGMSFLLTALFFKAIFDKGKIKTSLLASIVCINALLLPCKVIYGLLLLLVFLIPKKRFCSKKQRYIFYFSLLIASLGSVVLFELSNILNLLHSVAAPSTGAVTDGVGASVQSSPSLIHFVSHPLESLFIFVNTIFVYATFYFSTLLGGSLAYFQGNISLSFFFLLPYVVILLLAVQRFTSSAFSVDYKKKLVFCIIFIMGFLGLLFIFYLGGTANPLEGFVIEGIQGRYLLPLLPVFLLAFRVNRFYFKNNWSSFLFFVLFALNINYLVFIFASSYIA